MVVGAWLPRSTSAASSDNVLDERIMPTLNGRKTSPLRAQSGSFPTYRRHVWPYRGGQLPQGPENTSVFVRIPECGQAPESAHDACRFTRSESLNHGRGVGIVRSLGSVTVPTCLLRPDLG